MSEPFFVRVKPNPLASPKVAEIAKPLKDELKKKIVDKQKEIKKEVNAKDKAATKH